MAQRNLFAHAPKQQSQAAESNQSFLIEYSEQEIKRLLENKSLDDVQLLINDLSEFSINLQKIILTADEYLNQEPRKSIVRSGREEIEKLKLLTHFNEMKRLSLINDNPPLIAEYAQMEALKASSLSTVTNANRTVEMLKKLRAEMETAPRPK